MEMPVHPIGMIFYFFVIMYGMGPAMAFLECNFASCDLKAPWRYILFPGISLTRKMRFTIWNIICQLFSIIVFIITLILFIFNLVDDKMAAYNLYIIIAFGVIVFHFVYYIFLKTYFYFKKLE